MLPILLSFFMLVSCYSLITNATEKKAEYNGYVEVARASANDQITVDVIENYNMALDMLPSVDLYEEYANYFVGIGDKEGAITVAERMVEEFPKNAKASEYLASQYLNNESYKSFFAEYDRASAIGKVSNNFKKMFNENRYKYYLSSVRCSNVKRSLFSNVIFEDITREGGQEKVYYGYIFNKEKSIPAIYQNASFFNGGENAIAPVVTNDGQVYFIDKKGNKKAVIKPENIDVKQLGVYTSGVLSVFDGSKYYLSDIDSNIIAGPYDYISTFYDGVGVVKNNGKWNIINTKGKVVDSVSFDDVKLDDAGIAYNKGLFVKIGDKYSLVDKDGKAITDLTFDDACIFVDSYAAVKNGDKWGFINEKGELVIDYKYLEAKSFSSGYAAVNMNGKWGFITISDKKDIVVIDYQFDDAISLVGTKAMTFVKVGNVWNKLNLYYTD